MLLGRIILSALFVAIALVIIFIWNVGELCEIAAYSAVQKVPRFFGFGQAPSSTMIFGLSSPDAMRPLGQDILSHPS